MNAITLDEAKRDLSQLIQQVSADAEHLRQSIEAAKGGTTTERDLVDP